MQSPESSLSKGASLATVFSSPASEQSQLDITARNRTIFRRYAKTFANLNDPTFAEHAAKFAVWLSNQRGYYEAARPEIVKLLMIMHNAIRKAVNYPETQQVPLPLEAYMHLPMSHLYIQLVNTVHRFASIFTEPNLQILLKGLFFSVNRPYTPVNIEAVQAPAAPSAPVGTSVIAPSLVSQQQYALNPTQVLEAANSNQAALQTAVPHPVKMEASHPAAPDMQHGNVNVPSGSAGPRVRKRKRKALDLESLAEMDLKNYIEKQEKAQTQEPSLPGSGTQTVFEDLHTVPAASSGPGVSQQQSTIEAPLGPLSLDEIIEIPESPVNDDVPAEPVVAVVKSEPVEPVVPLAAPGQPPPLGGHVIDLTLSDDDELSANPDAMQVDEEPNPPEASPTMAVLDNLPSVDAEISPIPSDTSLPSEEAPEEASELTLANETVSDIDNEDANMDVDSGGSTLIPEPLPPDTILLEDTSISPVFEEETTIPQVIEEETAISQLIEEEEAISQAIEEEEAISQAIEEETTILPEISITGQAFVEELPQNTAREASLMTDGDEEHAPTISGPVLNGARKEEEEEESEEEVGEEEKQEPVVATPLPIADERIYGDEMKVVACRRGLKSNGLIRFTFDVGEDYLESILAWSKHDAPIAKLKSTLCISLGCYPISQVKLSEPIAPQITQLQSSWSGEGGLSIKFTYNSEMQSFSLSPPLLVSPDNTVDLSAFVQPGHNTFEISQHRNWSEHVFILLAHHPTEKQIQKVEAKKEEDEAWNNWLEEMAKPIAVQFPPAGYKGAIEPNRELEPRGILVSSEA